MSSSSEATVTVPDRGPNAYVARQPILSAEGHIFGYELLFRASAANVFVMTDFEHATASVIDHAISGWGLDKLTPNGRAFINFGRGALLREGYRVLPKERVVIELLESVEVDDELIAACRQLHDEGYMLALDDFALTPDNARLLEFADIVKVDFKAIKGDERVALAERLRLLDVIMLAEKVETQEEVKEARGMGFTLYQGYYFCKPEMLARREASVSKMSYLRLTSELNRPDISLERLEEIVKNDVALSLKLLRYLNSSGFGLRKKVTSIRQALLLLGERPFRRWATVMALRMMGADKTEELLVQSLVRARFCELVAPAAGLGGRELELFLVGLLSTVDALLDRPMVEVVDELPLEHELTETLLHHQTRLVCVFELALAWEQARWDEVERLAQAAHLGDRDLGADYRSAVAWVQKFMRDAHEEDS